MTFLQGLDYHWWWLLVAAVLGILEIFLPGIFLVWMALAAGITGLVVALSPVAMPLAWQLGIFALLAVAAVYSGRSVYARNPVASEDPRLNERASRLIGQTVTVETAIENGKGRVTVGDGVWNARGPDLPSGAKVRVVGADGTCLTVEPA
jgi:membrane protein implicated in regulation of membrane protease activity